VYVSQTVPTRSQYKNQETGEEEYIAVSQFQPTDAR
jgi:hypothetical protein